MKFISLWLVLLANLALAGSGKSLNSQLVENEKQRFTMYSPPVSGKKIDEFFKSDKFTWTENFKQVDNDQLLKSALWCELNPTVQKCLHLCQIKEKLPPQFIESTRINGLNVVDFLKSKPINKENLVTHSQMQYSRDLNFTIELVKSLDSEENCTSYLIDNYPKIKNQGTLAKLIKYLDSLTYGNSEMIFASCEKYDDNSDKSKECVSRSSAFQCKEMMQKKDHIEKKIKLDLLDQRKKTFYDIQSISKSMSDTELDKYFGSMLNGKKQEDAAYAFVKSISLEAMFTSCLNSTNTEKCLKDITKKYNESMSKRGTSELTKVIKDSPELDVFHYELENFNKQLRAAKDQPEEERTNGDLKCLDTTSSKSSDEAKAKPVKTNGP